jgi:hypothetical protein
MKAIGVVVEVGSEVRDIKLGDLAVTAVRHPCLHDDCRACRMGHQDFCFTGDFTEHGIKETHGFMTEFVVDEERYMYLVPRDLRDVDVLTEPLTVAENAKQCVKRYAFPLATHDYHAILNQLCAEVSPFIPITPFHCIRSPTRGRLPLALGYPHRFPCLRQIVRQPGKRLRSTGVLWRTMRAPIER